MGGRQTAASAAAGVTGCRHSFQVHSSCTDGLAYQARCVLSESTLQFLLLNN